MFTVGVNKYVSPDILLFIHRQLKPENKCIHIYHRNHEGRNIKVVGGEKKWKSYFHFVGYHFLQTVPKNMTHRGVYVS